MFQRFAPAAVINNFIIVTPIGDGAVSEAKAFIKFVKLQFDSFHVVLSFFLARFGKAGWCPALRVYERYG